MWILPRAVICFLYLFHMPLFAFVSGWFSTDTARAREQAVSGLLPAYLLWNLVCTVLDHFVSGTAWQNFVLYPVSHMWYLAALFLWRYFAPELSRLKVPWLWGLGLSALCTLTGSGKDWPLLAGCITYGPFFLLGLNLPEERLSAIRRLPKAVCALVLVLVFGLICWLLRSGYTVSQLGFYVAESKTGLTGAVILLTRYLAASIIAICVLNLIPTQSMGITALGTLTMPVYLIHNLPGLRNLIYRLCPVHTSLPLSLCWWTLWCCLAVLIPSAVYRWIVKKRPPV